MDSDAEPRPPCKMKDIEPLPGLESAPEKVDAGHPILRAASAPAAGTATTPGARLTEPALFPPALSNHDQGRQDEQNPQCGCDKAAQHADHERHEDDQLVATLIKQGREPQDGGQGR